MSPRKLSLPTRQVALIMLSKSARPILTEHLRFLFGNISGIASLTILLRVDPPPTFSRASMLPIPPGNPRKRKYKAKQLTQSEEYELDPVADRQKVFHPPYYAPQMVVDSYIIWLGVVDDLWKLMAISFILQKLQHTKKFSTSASPLCTRCVSYRLHFLSCFHALTNS